MRHDMRSTTTAVLERNTVVREDFATEPYELPWAAEARFFVQALDLDGPLVFRTEISPDGLHWCPLDDVEHRIDAPGLITWAVSGFGQWLRVRCAVGPGTTGKLRIYLVGKG
ncbi:hypothetical protein [Amycolatopsis thermoflava]|nr:hypothetical protein [Amycolatopsis thermoflava]